MPLWIVCSTGNWSRLSCRLCPSIRCLVQGCLSVPARDGKAAWHFAQLVILRRRRRSFQRRSRCFYSHLLFSALLYSYLLLRAWSRVFLLCCWNSASYHHFPSLCFYQEFPCSLVVLHQFLVSCPADSVQFPYCLLQVSYSWWLTRTLLLLWWRACNFGWFSSCTLFRILFYSWCSVAGKRVFRPVGCEGFRWCTNTFRILFLLHGQWVRITFCRSTGHWGV